MRAFLGLAVAILLIVLAKAQYKPPCEKDLLCQNPLPCYTCTDAEYQVFSNGVAGYPASAQCSAKVTNCLYCWKQKHTITLADGWTSDFQYKSCIPWTDVDTCSSQPCPAQYARYRIDYCQKFDMEKTREACALGGWCTKTTTECACSTQLCNLGLRAHAHQMATLIFASLAVVLLMRKCCTV